MEIIKYLTFEQASEIASRLTNSYPSDDRLLIVSPTGEQQTNGGLIIPKVSKEEFPRKGTIIQMGFITDPDCSYRKLGVGDLITYGLYAGKELELPDAGIPKGYTATILSTNEILYIEKVQKPTK